MSRRFPVVLVVALASTSLAFVAEARAQGVGSIPTGSAAEASDELAALEKTLSTEHAALSTSDCMTACRALASIRRAADRICALDPEERCAAARTKADDATRRVREACPDCAVASAPPRPTPPMAKPASKGGAPAQDEERASVQTADAPPSESRRGGCAGCTTSRTTAGDRGALALALGALAWVMRRRRSKRPRA